MVTGMLETQPEAMDALTLVVPMARLGKAEEIADAVLWLCSDAASFIIGHALPVFGADERSDLEPPAIAIIENGNL